jgi:hypothetical protein
MDIMGAKTIMWVYNDQRSIVYHDTRAACFEAVTLVN